MTDHWKLSEQERRDLANQHRDDIEPDSAVAIQPWSTLQVGEKVFIRAVVIQRGNDLMLEVGNGIYGKTRFLTREVDWYYDKCEVDHD